MSIIRAKDVYKSFQSEIEKIEVLRGADFSASEGEVIVIYGVSGAGKSTLLHILGTLDEPDSGEVMVNGVNVFECSQGDLNQMRNEQFGFVFQFHYLLPEFSALENVMIPGMLKGDGRNHLREKAAVLLAEVGLSHRYSHRPAELSGGEQQRVAVARALMNDPSIILADEPSGNLDDRNSELLHNLIMRLSDSKKQTFVIVTHKREIIEKADRCLVLKDGVLIEDGG